MAGNSTITALSQELSHLKGECLDRSLQKIKLLGTEAPFLLPNSMFKGLTDVELPLFEFGDLVCYLVLTTSFYTCEKMKA